jgi:ATP-dependent Lhr-like helicase
MKQLRENIKPVSAADYMRFLFEWQGNTPNNRQTGAQALARVLQQLEGFSVPASAWESDVLPGRIDLYTATDLDRLCGGGQFIWARLPNKNKIHSGPVKATPVAFLEREHALLWLGLSVAVDTTELSSTAQTILTCLQTRGALFFIDMVQHTGLLRTQVETALGELAANGLINSDSFTGLRALITPTNKRPAFSRRSQHRVYSGVLNDIDNAGRWSLMPKLSLPSHDNNAGQTGSWLDTPYETLEHIAQVLLQRYGVVFRKLLERESLLPPWRELLYVYRRLEARGEIRGGRFVDGFSGEQFALPEAAGALRKTRDTQNDRLQVISAADPLNLTGIILPGERVPAMTNNRILFKNGLPVAVQLGPDIRFLDELSKEDQWNVRTQLMRRQKPAAYLHANASIRN